MRKAYCEGGLEAALNRKPSVRAYRRRLDGEAEAHLIALACSPPPEGHVRWTLRLVRDRFVEAGYAEPAVELNLLARGSDAGIVAPTLLPIAKSPGQGKRRQPVRAGVRRRGQPLGYGKRRPPARARAEELLNNYNASSRDIFGCSKNRQNRIVENSTYPLDDFGFR